MQGIERDYCDVCISALIAAKCALMDSSGAEALRKVNYGKGDTLGLDSTTEITICRRIEDYDRQAIIVTEERDVKAREHWPTDPDPERQPVMFFCDPTDRSSPLKNFIERISKNDPTAKVGALMGKCDPTKIWEEMYEAPVSITGPTTSITCVRKGSIVFTVILNLITDTMVVVTDIGVFHYDTGKSCGPGGRELTLDQIAQKGKLLQFRGVRGSNYSLDDCRRFVTFLGKTIYPDNFNDSGLFVENAATFLHHSEPPGPPRPLYLSELQKHHGPVGFILGNGEKIGEWMPWLAFVKYAKNRDGGNALRAWEISLERPWTKNGMLMCTPLPYSIFCGSEENPSLGFSRLCSYDRPSQFRCMLVVVHHDNERMINVLEEHQYREVTGLF